MEKSGKESAICGGYSIASDAGRLVRNQHAWTTGHMGDQGWVHPMSTEHPFEDAGEAPYCRQTETGNPDIVGYVVQEALQVGITDDFDRTLEELGDKRKKPNQGEERERGM